MERRKIPLIYCVYILLGGFNHLEKYESHLGVLFPIYGKIKKCSYNYNIIYIYIYIIGLVRLQS